MFLVSEDQEVRSERVPKLVWFEEVVGVARSSVDFVPLRERFVDEERVGREQIDECDEAGPVQIVRYDDGVERFALERPFIDFEVGFHHGDSRVAPHFGKARHIAIDGNDREPLLEQEAGVSSSPARHVEHSATWADLPCEPRDPIRRSRRTFVWVV